MSARVVIVCDAPGCTARTDTEAQDEDSARDAVGRRGWTSLMLCGEMADFCERHAPEPLEDE